MSTRGGDEASFAEAISRGYARDGGLYMPASVPEISLAELESWQHHTYALLCEEILAKFVGDEIPRNHLRTLLTRCFGTFSEHSVVPLTHLADRSAVDDVWLAELFHGPVSLPARPVAPRCRVAVCVRVHAGSIHPLQVSSVVETRADEESGVAGVSGSLCPSRILGSRCSSRCSTTWRAGRGARCR